MLGVVAGFRLGVDAPPEFESGFGPRKVGVERHDEMPAAGFQQEALEIRVCRLVRRADDERKPAECDLRIAVGAEMKARAQVRELRVLEIGRLLLEEAHPLLRHPVLHRQVGGCNLSSSPVGGGAVYRVEDALRHGRHRGRQALSVEPFIDFRDRNLRRTGALEARQQPGAEALGVDALEGMRVEVLAQERIEGGPPETAFQEAEEPARPFRS